MCGTRWLAAVAGSGAFAAAPDDPYEFSEGIRGFTAWLDFAKPRPVFPPHGTSRTCRPRGKAPALSLLGLPLGGGRQGKSCVVTLTFKVRAACVQRPPQSCGSRFTRGLNARVHSVFFLTDKKKTSLAPCALAGDPLAMGACEPETDRDHLSVSANERLQTFTHRIGEGGELPITSVCGSFLRYRPRFVARKRS